MLNNRELGIIYKRIAKAIYSEQVLGKKFNRYEYYKMGGLPLRKALDVIYKLRNRGFITSGEYAIIHNYLENQLILGPSRNKEFILSTYYQFGEYVISEDEKQMIWKKINDMGLEDKDIDDLVFSAAVREYAYQKGILKIKKRVLKNKKRNR